LKNQNKEKNKRWQHLQQSESSVESLTFRSRVLFTTSAMIRAVENDSQRQQIIPRKLKRKQEKSEEEVKTS